MYMQYIVCRDSRKIYFPDPQKAFNKIKEEMICHWWLLIIYAECRWKKKQAENHRSCPNFAEIKDTWYLNSTWTIWYGNSSRENSIVTSIKFAVTRFHCKPLFAWCTEIHSDECHITRFFIVTSTCARVIEER